MLRVTISLHQTEPFGIIVFKRADAQIFRIVQRPPQPFVIAVPLQQTVAVVNLGTMIVKLMLVVFAEQKH